MKKMTKACLAIISAGLLVGCGTDNAVDNAVQEVKNTAKEYKMMGTWQSECHDSTLLDASVKDFYEFAGNDFVKVTEFYSTDECSEPLARIRYKGDFNVGKDNQQITDAKDLEFTYEEVTLVPLTEAGANLLSAANLCGVEEWAVGKTETITQNSDDATCPVEKVPQTKLDLVKVENDQLFLGEQEEGAAADERPSKLQEKPFTESDRNLSDEE